MELRKIGAYFLQYEWSSGHKYRRCPPQGIYGTRWPRRSGTTRGRGCHFVSVAGRFIVAPLPVHVRPLELTVPKFPGYPANSSCQVCPPDQSHSQALIMWWKIHVLGWARNRLPITRSKLSHEVAKKVERYLASVAVRSSFNRADFTAHDRTVESSFEWIRRGSMEGWRRLHAHRQYVSGPPCICLQGILPTGDLGRGPFGASGPCRLRMSAALYSFGLTFLWFPSFHVLVAEYISDHHL